MATNRFTELVGCAIPISQAGMGAVSPPELAAAVSEAGALGMVGTARRGITVVTLGSMLDWMQEHTRRPYGVNFVIPDQWAPPDRACIALAARRARVVEFFYNEPNSDFIVAQGIEAGGHVRGTPGTKACPQLSRPERVACGSGRALSPPPKRELTRPMSPL